MLIRYYLCGYYLVMFNKYWREYPWFLQLMQFVLLIFICTAFFSVFTVYLVPLVTGVDLDAIKGLSAESSPGVRIAAFITQGAGHIGIFLVPSALFAYAVHPHPLKYLGIIRPKDNRQWLLVLLLAITTVPTVSGIAGLLDKIPLSEDLTKAKESFMHTQNAFLNITTPAELITALLVIGLIPAIGEELLFRGIILKFSAKKMKGNIFWSILLTATFFTVMHGNLVGTISLLIAGLMLGYVYYLTGSLILAMFAHFIINGSQVVLAYMGSSDDTLKGFTETNDTPWGLFIGGIALFVVSFYLLYKYRTPLPANWTNDFSEAELAEREQEQKNNF